jgi:hypothetical protein
MTLIVGAASHGQIVSDDHRVLEDHVHLARGKRNWLVR